MNIYIFLIKRKMIEMKVLEISSAFGKLEFIAKSSNRVEYIVELPTCALILLCL